MNAAITLAVVASVRHEDTEYDSLLMSGVARDIARDQTRPAVDRILAAWSWRLRQGARSARIPARHGARGRDARNNTRYDESRDDRAGS